MSFHSPRQSQSQFQYNPSTPPLPPPKPSGHSSSRGTPVTGPPLPPPPPGQSGSPYLRDQQNNARTTILPDQYPQQHASAPHIQVPEEGWLPDILKDKATPDLHAVLQDAALQKALTHDPHTTHPSIPASTAPLDAILTANLQLAHSLNDLHTHLQHTRASTQSRLLALRALEGQWRAKQTEQDAALREFSPPALYQRLSAAVGEQEALCRGLEESFLEGEGRADEREVAEFVRRVREGKKIGYLRRERRERWDEGRVGGWRG
ncbi:hypothetical protein M501DRAFT_998503 [Patellaria atrata CBS 101060]|uniref:VPS37 C-terminal domain-containing protein n=1 Tax=Patellaria atrata CBS 101060 TaxID=1346257 RepID=A0A9P4SI61_9PEZI|nr:hypothetical protein M501DRAFT_998503 [Patellaria atrata CBS 101060]